MSQNLKVKQFSMFVAYFRDIKDLPKSRGLGENLYIKFF